MRPQIKTRNAYAIQIGSVHPARSTKGLAMRCVEDVQDRMTAIETIASIMPIGVMVICVNAISIGVDQAVRSFPGVVILSVCKRQIATEYLKNIAGYVIYTHIEKTTENVHVIQNGAAKIARCILENAQQFVMDALDQRTVTVSDVLLMRR